MTLLVVIISIIFTSMIYRTQEISLIHGIDEKLLIAANSVEHILPENHHDKLIDENSIPPDEYLKMIDINNKYCEELNLEYVWSLLELKNGTIVFSSSTSISKNVSNGDHALFFDVHSNPGAFYKTFSTMQTQYRLNNNEWGRIKLVLIPHYDKFGRKFLYGAGVKLDDVDAALYETLINSLILNLIVLIAGIILSLFFSSLVSRPLVKLTTVTKKISEGEYKEKIDIKGSEEMSSLSKSINIMNQAIARQIVRLKNNKIKLDKNNKKLSQNNEELEAMNEELKDSNEELAKSNEKITELYDAKSYFLNQVAHDLRTPLTPISTLIPIVQKDKNLSKKSKEHLNIVKRNTNSLLYLITNVLNLVRLEKGKFKLNFEKYDINKTVSSFLRDRKELFKQHKIKIKVKLDSEIPMVKFDKNKILEVMGNIMSNSERFIEKGKGILEISTHKSSESVKISIKDNGKGIIQSEMKHVFEEFYTSEQYQGGKTTGLGLPICKKIIDEHKGRIWMESKGLNKGTTVYFTLPLK